MECMLKLPQYEPVDWVSPQRGQVMIDVGAYTGWYSIQAGRAVGESGQVVALEPDETNRRQLVNNLKLNQIENVTVSSLAAWSKPGVLGWYVGAQPVWHRIDSKSESACVETTTIDELAREAGLRRVDWMKLDIEGAELEVLVGASAVLQEFHPSLFIEVHCTFDPLQQFLSSAGYVIARQAFDRPPKEHGWILAHSGTSR